MSAWLFIAGCLYLAACVIALKIWRRMDRIEERQLRADLGAINAEADDICRRCRRAGGC